MAVYWHSGSWTAAFPEHTAKCGWPAHHVYAFGVYDRHGQRLNAFQTIVCSRTSDFDLAECAADQVQFWPGSQVCAWADVTVEPPASLRFGPAPDVTVS